MSNRLTLFRKKLTGFSARRHNRAMRVAKALAATAVEVLADASLLADIKREFASQSLS